MDKQDLNNSLNHLIERNYDAEEGYKQVAENLKHPALKAILDKNIAERYRFGHDLKAIMKDLGMEIKKGTSIEGDVHRAWMSLKEAFSSNNDKALVEEALRGEKVAEEAYKEVLANDALQPGHADILRNHLESITSSKRDLQQLESNLETAK